MEPGFLITTFSIIFFTTWKYIWRRDVLFGTIYFFLFVYAVFAQIGYAYFPEISILIEAYFEPEIFYPVNIFVTLSFVTFFLFFVFLYPKLVSKPSYQIKKSRLRLVNLFYMAIACHFLGLALYFFENFDLVSYENAPLGMINILFSIGFKLSVVVILLLYFLYRVRTNDAPDISRRIVFIFLILETALFFVVSFNIGSRTDLLALTISIAVLEITLYRQSGGFSRVKSLVWAPILLLVSGVGYALLQIEEIRGGREANSLVEAILLKDYYAPFHILIAVIAFDYIDPWEVIVSNSANALILLNQPHLQTIVTELFNPGVATRSAGYAFYLFGEGFMATGWLGFLYNGLVVFAGIALWRLMANSNCEYYNLFMIALMATQAVNITRGQSSYFIKDIYMFFIPAMALFYLATSLRPRFGRKK